MKQTKLWPAAPAAIMAALTALVGCSPELATATSPPDESVVKAYPLTLHGYNYSDTGIGSFEVAGGGGGNVEISTPDTGGGKSACCATVYAPLTRPRQVTIKWTRDLQTWCEQEVVLNPPLPAKPEYFEVHFYRDGHIEVAVTERPSPPRLQLSRYDRGGRYRDPKNNVNNDAKFGRCKLGYD